MDQSGKVANPACCDRLKKENVFFPSPRSRVRIWSLFRSNKGIIGAINKAFRLELLIMGSLVLVQSRADSGGIERAVNKATRQSLEGCRRV